MAVDLELGMMDLSQGKWTGCQRRWMQRNEEGKGEGKGQNGGLRKWKGADGRRRHRELRRECPERGEKKMGQIERREDFFLWK